MKNIFAEVLAEVLAEHDKELGSLYSMTSYFDVMTPNKVSLIIKSLTPDGDNSAVLSAWELDIVREYFRKTPRAPGKPPKPISPQQDRRLKAAIFAEGIRRFVLDRLKSEAEHVRVPLAPTARTDAYRIGRQAYDLLLTIKDPAGVLMVDNMMDTLRGGDLDLEENRPDDMPDTLRGGLELEEDQLRDAPLLVEALSPASPVASEAPGDPLATGVEVFMQGALWLEVARGFTDLAQQQAWATNALGLLTRAQALLKDVAPSDQQRGWLKEIDRALQDTSALL